MLNASDSILTGVSPGTYYAVAYREFCGEFLWDTSLQIIIPVPMDVVAQSAPVTCPEIPAGTFEITSISGGFAPYEISYDDGISFGNILSKDSLTAGSYPLVIRDSLGCLFRDTILIPFLPDIPIVILQEPPALTCIDTLQVIGISGTSQGGSFSGSWTGPFGTIPADLTQGLNVTQSGLYILELINAKNGCVRADTATILADQLSPAVQLLPVPVLTCVDTVLTIQGTVSPNAGLQFSWTTSNGVIQSDPNVQFVQITTAGEYMLLVTNPINGCKTLVETTVIADQVKPIAQFIDPTLLTCLNTGQWLKTIASSDPNWNLTWTNTSGQQIASGKIDSVFVQSPGTYYVEVVNPVNGCTDQAQIEVLQDIAIPVVDAGMNVTLSCHDTLVVLSGSLTNCSGCLPLWSHGSGQSISQPQQLQITTNQEGWFHLETVNSINGCTGLDSVEVIRIPEPETMTVMAILPNCQDPFGVLAFGPVTGGVPPFQYSFDGGSTFSEKKTLDPAPAGLYSLMVRDVTGCRLSIDTSMIAFSLPVLNLETDIELAYGESYAIQASTNIPPADILSIEWSPDSDLSCTDCLNPVATPLESITYELTVTDKNGCTVKADIRIDVALQVDVFVPSVFHPDGNGINDGFTAFADPEKVKRIVELRIYDRWGNAIFRATDIPVNQADLGWDGTYRGKPMDPAVFVYVVEVEFINDQRRLIKGDVTLAR